MSESSPKHGLTRTNRGWVKRVNRKPRWICSLKVAPHGDAADAYYEKHFTELWQEPAPLPDSPGEIVVSDLVDAFCNRKEAAVKGKTYREYVEALQEFIDAIGSKTMFEELTPLIFEQYARKIARLGVHRRNKFLIIVRSLFNWAGPTGMKIIPSIPFYGEAFTLPRKRDFRLSRKAYKEQHGLKMFTPAEIRKQIKKAKPWLKAMILLAVNAGFGNTDLAELPRSAVNLRSPWIDYARTKTGADRRAKLWPETINAIRDYLANRPKAAVRSPLLFITKFGQPYVRDGKDQIGMQYHALLDSLKQLQHGRNFYSLRRTYRTIAREVGAEMVVDLTMGHADDPADMAKVYTQTILDRELARISTHVRKRILG